MLLVLHCQDIACAKTQLAARSVQFNVAMFEWSVLVAAW